MKKFSKIMTSLAAVAVVFSMQNAAFSADLKYAVVDVPQVVAASKQVNNLKNQQNVKIQELANFVQNAQKQLQAEKNADKKKALETKLNKELNDKKVAMEKNYAAQLAGIDKNISAVIAQQAKAKGYDLVLAKGVVLYSTQGTDITNDVIKVVK
ncbi:MAG: OmpH family outer membrane protein [Candidatus Gastranaerophilaceae bacterium]